jgi:SulP family sulfate permease
MAYAKLAEMPLITGLYAASFACMVGGLLGRCGQLQTGPVAMTSLLAAAAVGSVATSPDEYIPLMLVLAVLVGFLRIAIGLVGGANLVALISRPVMVGFTTAAGITIASTQVPKLFGLVKDHENPVFASLRVVLRSAEFHWPTIIMGLGSLGVMILLKKYWPKGPGLLIALALAGLVSWLIDFGGMGGGIIGEVRQGLPAWSFPTEGWEKTWQLLPGALMVVVIGLLEVMTVTGAAERMHGTKPQLNGELVGQGAASIVAGCTGGFPVSGSLSRSSLNLLAGAQTAWSSVTSGLVVIGALLFLTPLLAPLPLASLAAAIVMACQALVRPGELLRAWRVGRLDAVFGAVTLFATLAMAPDMVNGMLIGIAMTIAYHLYHGMRPRVVFEGLQANGRWAKVASHPADSLQHGCLVARIDARITFLNATMLRDRLVHWLDQCPDNTPLILDASGINNVDYTGAMMFSDAFADLQALGHQMILCEVKKPVRRRLKELPGLEELPIVPTRQAAVEYGADVLRRQQGNEAGNWVI